MPGDTLPQTSEPDLVTGGGLGARSSPRFGIAAVYRRTAAVLLRYRLFQRLRARLRAGLGPADVKDVLDILRQVRVPVWVAGGWGVDALAGKQTRPHFDLDLVVAAADLGRAQAALQRRGFVVAYDEVVLGARMPDSVGLRDGEGRTVDLHPMHFEEPAPAGGLSLRGGVLTLRERRGDGERDSPFTTGRIGGSEVPCLTAAVQLAFHAGYELRDSDEHDLAVLAELAESPSEAEQPGSALPSPSVRARSPERPR